MSKEAVDRLRERAQNEATVIAMNNLCRAHEATIAALEKQNAELLAALKDITALAPAGSLAQHKAYFAIAGCGKTGALQPSTQEVSE